MGEHDGIVLGHQLVAGVIADGVPNVRIDYLTVASGLAAGFAGRVQFMGKRGGDAVEDVTPGVALALRARLEVDLGDGVMLAVHHHVQTRTEKMLMGGAVELRGHHATAAGRTLTGASAAVWMIPVSLASS